MLRMYKNAYRQSKQCIGQFKMHIEQNATVPFYCSINHIKETVKKQTLINYLIIKCSKSLPPFKSTLLNGSAYSHIDLTDTISSRKSNGLCGQSKILSFGLKTVLLWLQLEGWRIKEPQNVLLEKPQDTWTLTNTRL